MLCGDYVCVCVHGAVLSVCVCVYVRDMSVWMLYTLRMCVYVGVCLHELMRVYAKTGRDTLVWIIKYDKYIISDFSSIIPSKAPTHSLAWITSNN